MSRTSLLKETFSNYYIVMCKLNSLMDFHHVHTYLPLTQTHMLIPAHLVNPTTEEFIRIYKNKKTFA